MTRKAAILLPILVVGVFLDQLTKLLVVRHLPLGGQVPVIQGFFNLVHVRNRGAAFGLLANLSVQFAWLFFILTTLLVLGVVGYLWWRLPDSDRLAALGYSLIMAGALGNLIDRVRLWEVIDFLDFYLGRHHWPAFNVADSLVCLGAGVLIWLILTEEKRKDASHPL
jgi:signal peptidase II|uniref:Lipoprotein signal peptidase n=1 Tax=Desulfobacca acetoxidans TaxID=60893 RepID=A0A7C3SIY8_9BACT